MIIAPAFRGPLSVTAHPAGCAAHLRSWLDRARAAEPIAAPRRVLVVGSSGGLGLAARVGAAFGGGSGTVGVCLERGGSETRTATPGWYRSAAFEEAAGQAGLPAATVVGDAFAERTKAATCDVVRDLLGQVDLVVYSVAAPRRTHPHTGTVHRSVIKTVGEPFTEKGYTVSTGQVREMTLGPATEAEIADTVAVMGGEDWAYWLSALGSAGVLAPGARTVALSYVGTPQLAPTYRQGTLGAAKDDLERTARQLDAHLAESGGGAHVAVMQALVTQSSVAIPMSSLYTVLLLRALADAGIRQDVFDQGRRLIADGFADGARPSMDDFGRIRMDDREFDPAVQAQVWDRWAATTSENLAELGDVAAFDAEMRALYGFGILGVDYAADCDPAATFPGAVLVD
ncbi:enoyl-ACP reductase FabV [Actinokineospora sp.]|uniref:enoyl-ACP reductase FabV n=1 Tax=Actinokineospora sp. TaxID=1872133 RepID=UPI004037D037